MLNWIADARISASYERTEDNTANGNNAYTNENAAELRMPS